MSGPPSYESIIAYLSQYSNQGGIKSSTDLLHLFLAMLQNPEGLPAPDRLAELAYYLDDQQRQWLRQCAEAANRLDDAAIAGEMSQERYYAEKTRRFGTQNPERMDVAFWKFMVQRRWSAFRARQQFDSAGGQDMTGSAEEQAPGIEPRSMQLPRSDSRAAVWSFKRFGMSQTHLPDGRTIYIAGEHEDYYDPDFCIYNDAIVIDRDLHLSIYGYPETVFPPTDFHTATLAADGQIYIIGNLGYAERRQVGETPVYRLDTREMRMEPISTRGVQPGWISDHVAEFEPERHGILVSEGQVWTHVAGMPLMQSNAKRYWLDLATLEWRVV